MNIVSMKCIYKKTFIFSMIALMNVSLVFAQSDLKLGQWKSYLPYKLGRYVTQSENEVYIATEWSIIVYDKQEYSFDFLSKIEGLSETGMGPIKYIKQNNTLLATYRNSEFDLITEDEVITFTNLKEDGNFFDRRILDVHLFKDSMAYFSTAFGVVEFNTGTQKFGFTANFGIPVNSFNVYDGYYFAATDEGLYRALDNPAVNHKDLGNWVLMDVADGFPAVYGANATQNFEDKMFLEIGDSLYTWTEDDGLNLEFSEESFGISYLTADGEHLIIGQECYSNCNGKVRYYKDGAIQGALNQDCITRPLYGVEDQYGQVWMADNRNDFRVADIANGDCRRFEVNSPLTQRVTQIVLNDNDVWLTTEVISPTNNNASFLGDGIFLNRENDWTYYNRSNNSALGADNTLSFYQMAIHPENKKVYVATLWNGLVEWDEGAIQVFGKNNSSLQVSADTNRVRVAGLAFDSGNNLWMTNNTAFKPISVFKADGTWTNDFNYQGLPSNAMRQITIDLNGYKWIAMDSRGLWVYDDNGTIDDPSDDRRKHINAGNSELPTDRIRSIEIDNDGDVWVGTTEGVVVFECGGNVFDDNCIGFRRAVDVNGILGFLLETESINSIAVDGANRKWFGTNSGIFVQSPNGEDQIAFFDEQNSPLFDNLINDIEINGETGEVYIGTGKGLMSVRGEALDGAPFQNKDNIYAYPNPVRPDYEGPIAIKGLAENANIKITDVSGQLMFETTALGGQAIWDGKDYNGRKAASGVYLVFSTRTSGIAGSDAIATKILLLN